MRSTVAALFLGVALAIATSSSAQLGGSTGGLKGALPGAPRPIACTTVCSLAGMQVGQVAIIRKGSSTSRASVIARTVDPDLQFSSAPSGLYYSTLAVTFSSTQGNWRLELITANNNNEQRLFHECGNTSTVARWTALATQNCIAGVGGSGVEAFGYISTSGGTFQLHWAQDTSNATATTVSFNSYWILVRIS